MTSTITQAHPRYTADGQPRRTGQIRHQSPKPSRRMVSAMKLHSRSCDTSPVRKRAGGNDSQKRPMYSSTECAACARSRAANASLNRIFSGVIVPSVRRASAQMLPLPYSTNHVPLSQVIVPELLQPLGRDRHGRAQLLREERDAQLLDEPAELLELRIGASRIAVGLRPRLVLLPQPLHRARVLLVALGARAVLRQA